jgi:hypothetical protein
MTSQLQACPSGGWSVKLTGHPVPVSRHDTEVEAHAKAAAYRRGVERAHTQGARLQMSTGDECGLSAYGSPTSPLVRPLDEG